MSVSVFETMLVDTKITPDLRKFYFKISLRLISFMNIIFFPFDCFALETFIKISAKHNFLRVKNEKQIKPPENFNQTFVQ